MQNKKFTGHICFLSFLLGLASVAQADDNYVELSNAPLFVSSAADPNMLFILDDSGSMRWGFIPDGLVDDFEIGEWNEPCEVAGHHAGQRTCFYSITGRKFGASNHTNPMYYNPDVKYEPPVKGDGNRHPNATFNKAWLDGYNGAGDDTAVTVDLSNDYRAIMDDYYWKEAEDCIRLNPNDQCTSTATFLGFTIGSVSGTGSSETSGEGAFYYNYVGGDTCDGENGDPTQDICFGTKQTISAEDEQNFANWFSYYRTRILAARAGITAAFMDQPSNMRVGYGGINLMKGEEGAITRGVRPFSGDDRAAFFSWLHETPAVGSTPLREALNLAGKYFKDSSDTGPWATTPGSGSWSSSGSSNEDEAVTDFAECRQSFTILMTDGYYNGPAVEVGNVDDAKGKEIKRPGGLSFTYEPKDPFKDSHSNTLADIAMKYWKQDLQPQMQNRVPTTERNPAFWQHMVTFGVGLGVHGDIDPEDAWAALESGSSISWPNPQDGDQEKIDDLLHAAVNSRGGFFSADDPDTFATDLSGILSQIAEAVGSSTGVTFDTATLEEDSLIFAARFDSSRWSGDLDARPLLVDEDDPEALPEIGTPVWSAARRLDNRDLDTNPRQIITSDGSKGIPFQCDALQDFHLADLRFGAGTEAERDQRAEDRLKYLRGDSSLEGVTDGFRVRDSRLGAIVNSTPVRVAAPASGWPDTEHFGEKGLPEQGKGKRYSDFRITAADRKAVIYAGANDGMLHGFLADDSREGGHELLAFMPSAIFSSEASRGLHYLTTPTYAHRYYVDLPPLVSDAYIKGRTATGGVTAEKNWRTVLLGGSGVGAKGIFALDVTNPALFNEANAAQLLLWEFTAEDDEKGRMGFITEPPVIGLAKWGRQGNTDDYRWTAFFANGYNSEKAATGFFMLDLEGGLNGEWEEGKDYRFIEFGTNGSGLSSLSIYDDTGNRLVDRVYAGDRDGNLWVAAVNARDGGFSNAYAGNPLFTAKIGEQTQPITSAPLIIRHDGARHVLFGTGQYLNEADKSDTQQQSLYSVREDGTSNRKRGELTERTLNEVVEEGTETRFLTSTGIEGTDTRTSWFVDLFEEGERITLSPQVRGNYIFANSSIPSDNPCVAGGATRVMAFGLTGLTPDRAVFKGFDGKVVSYKLDDGIASQSAFLGNYRFTPTSVGDVVVEGIDTGNPAAGLGRQGWQELIE